MAHFLARAQGNRGTVSRVGSKRSGLQTTAASWQGAVTVYLYHDEATGKDNARVSLEMWHGRGVSRILYDGPVSGMPS